MLLCCAWYPLFLIVRVCVCVCVLPQLFDRLLAKGKGHATVDLEEFQRVLQELKKDPVGKKLLKLMLSAHKGEIA